MISHVLTINPCWTGIHIGVRQVYISNVGQVPTLTGENHRFLFLLVRTELEWNVILKTKTLAKTGTRFHIL
jgi:hypothetical protein